MNRMTPALARLLVEERLEVAKQQRRHRAERREETPAPRVPQQRRGSGLLTRVVPRTGVRKDTR